MYPPHMLINNKYACESEFINVINCMYLINRLKNNLHFFSIAIHVGHWKLVGAGPPPRVVRH